jgi:hypothetical protein
MEHFITPRVHQGVQKLLETWIRLRSRWNRLRSRWNSISSQSIQHISVHLLKGDKLGGTAAEEQLPSVTGTVTASSTTIGVLPVSSLLDMFLSVPADL